MRSLLASLIGCVAMSAAVHAAESPDAVFRAYAAAVEAGDIEPIKKLIAENAARPPFARCDAALTDRECLISYIDNTVVKQHTRFTVVSSEVIGQVVAAKLEVRNDLTSAAGIDRLLGTDKIKVQDGKIIEFGFFREEQDEQTIKFFAHMMKTAGR